MKKKVKALWVKALRENRVGETKAYKARLQLRKGQTHFCCLGVLCELYRVETGKGEWVKNKFVLGKEESESFPPDKVRTWAGLTEFDFSRYASINDRGGSFREIADDIEETM